MSNDQSARHRQASLICPWRHAIDHFFSFCPKRSEQIVRQQPEQVSRYCRLARQIIVKALDTETSPHEFIALFNESLDNHQLDLASACLGAACLKIWDSGQDFHRFHAWIDRGLLLVEKEENIPPPARSFLLLNLIMALITGPVDLEAAELLIPQCQNAVDQSGIPNLHLLQSSLIANLYYWQGDLAALNIHLDDSAPFLDHPQASDFAVIHHRAAHGMLKTLQGHPEQGLTLLRPLTDHPEINNLPPILWMLIHSHLLYTEAVLSNHDCVNKLAQIIRQRTVPEQNHYYHSYLQFTLAMAELNLGHPHKALLHGRECRRRGQLCQSPNAARMSALVIGQALADLDRTSEALAHFKKWLPRWNEARYLFVAAMGYVEMADLLVRMGNIDQAREYLHQSRKLRPKNEPLPCLHRPTKRLEELEQLLLHRPHQIEVEQPGQPIKIRTLGEFSVTVHEHSIYDRQWHGARNRQLLLLLLAQGGKKVSTQALAGQLWPDVDGDRAMNSFKVTLSRLRKVVSNLYPELKSWLVVKQGCLSLSASLCTVDAWAFEHCCRIGLESSDPDLLRHAAQLYQGNFLIHSEETPWIISYRHTLRRNYIKLVFCLADFLLHTKADQEALDLMEQATQHDPCNEALYIRLIRAHLKAGHSGKARELHAQACTTLRQQLGCDPGPGLRTVLTSGLSRQSSST